MKVELPFSPELNSGWCTTAIVHAADDAEPHSPRDPYMHATLSRLEQLFDREYVINRDRPPARGVAMGRYEGDTYYAGGAGGPTAKGAMSGMPVLDIAELGLELRPVGHQDGLVAGTHLREADESGNRRARAFDRCAGRRQLLNVNAWGNVAWCHHPSPCCWPAWPACLPNVCGPRRSRH